MRWIALIAFVLFVPLASLSQTPPPSQPLGAGRPETPGITRTTLKDDAKSTVTRVHFAPGAAEPPHTHPYDVILVPVITGPVDFGAGDKTLTALKSGEVQFVPRDVVHHVANTGKQPFELIAIAVK
jgi:quercetin dioxygenase-like cupin family protein